MQKKHIYASCLQEPIIDEKTEVESWLEIFYDTPNFDLFKSGKWLVKREHSVPKLKTTWTLKITTTSSDDPATLEIEYFNEEDVISVLLEEQFSVTLEDCCCRFMEYFVTRVWEIKTPAFGHYVDIVTKIDSDDTEISNNGGFYFFGIRTWSFNFEDRVDEVVIKKVNNVKTENKDTLCHSKFLTVLSSSPTLQWKLPRAAGLGMDALLQHSYSHPVDCRLEFLPYWALGDFSRSPISVEQLVRLILQPDDIDNDQHIQALLYLIVKGLQLMRCQDVIISDFTFKHGIPFSPSCSLVLAGKYIVDPPRDSNLEKLGLSTEVLNLVSIEGRKLLKIIHLDELQDLEHNGIAETWVSTIRKSIRVITHSNNVKINIADHENDRHNMNSVKVLFSSEQAQELWTFLDLK